MKKISAKLLEIDWVDSHAANGWMPLNRAIEPASLACRSVGYLLADNRDSIVLGAHLCLNEEDNVPDKIGMIDGHMIIPKCAIVAKRVIGGRR